MNIAINGFGRIGRMVLRAAIENDAEINVINDPEIKEPAYFAYLFKHDSTHGRYFGKICYDDKHLIVNRMKVKLFMEKDPKKVPWKECGGDFVIESSGIFKTMKKAQAFIDAGAKKVIIGAPSSDCPMYVYGVNLDKYNPKENIVSMASCTTNCLAPLVKVIFDKYGIEEALMCTIHSVTNSQKLIDGTNLKKWRSGRGGMQNIIPAATGAAKAVTRVIPELKGKITGSAYRVPTADVSVVDLTVKLCQCTDYEDIKCAIRDAANCKMKGILGYTEEQVVSSDFIGCKCSSVFDAGAGIQLNDRFFKLVSWYDNEVGYANRLIDFVKFIQDADCSPKPICGIPKKPCPPQCPPKQAPPCPKKPDCPKKECPPPCPCPVCPEPCPPLPPLKCPTEKCPKKEEAAAPCPSKGDAKGGKDEKKKEEKPKCILQEKKKEPGCFGKGNEKEKSSQHPKCACKK